jgi:hypothetical protein
MSVTLYWLEMTIRCDEFTWRNHGIMVDERPGNLLAAKNKTSMTPPINASKIML